MTLIIVALQGGVDALIDYILAHTATCLVPAFFIAGALYALFPKQSILRYFGPTTPRYISYPLSVAAGLLLAVCSCTVLPLFAGIRRSGGGLGPALTFVYTAPATNILAIIYTGGLIGYDLAIARIVLSITFACITGLVMSAIFHESPQPALAPPMAGGSAAALPKTNPGVWVLFGLLVAILFAGTSILIVGTARVVALTVLLIALAVVIRTSLSREQIRAWLRETWFFVKMIFPLLLVGVFVAGILGAIIPRNFLAAYLGGNTLWANLGMVLFGVVMYFPTLVEVPMARLFLDLGIGRGPLLAYILADPVISLPSILVLRRFIGTRQVLVYAGLITVCCTAAGLIYGAIYGAIAS